MRRMHLIGTLLVLPGLSLSGCGNAPVPPQATTTTTVISAPSRMDTTTPRTTSPSLRMPTPFDCRTQTAGWSTRNDVRSSQLVRGQIIEVRTGVHPCFDRVVFDIETTELVAYRVGYVSGVNHVGSGKAVPVDGGAVLRVDISAPATTSRSVVDLDWRNRWPALRQIANAGSFEGATVFAIGVDHKVPFTAALLPDTESGTMRVVIDIAHENN